MSGAVASGGGAAKGPSGTSCSPRTRSAGLLVTSTCTAGACSTRLTISGATSITCSRLSRSSNAREVPRNSTTVSRGLRPVVSRTPSWSATVAITRSGSETEASAT